MNKRGDERILSLYWFVMFIIIGIAVVSGVAIFYGSPSDVREIEATILTDKVVECFMDQGNLKNGIGDKEIDIEKECKLSFKDTTHKAYEKVQYYVEASVGGKTFYAGNKEWKEYCDISSSKKNIPVCAEKTVIALNKDEYIKLVVKGAVRKVEQNAK